MRNIIVFIKQVLDPEVPYSAYQVDFVLGLLHLNQISSCTRASKGGDRNGMT